MNEPGVRIMNSNPPFSLPMSERIVGALLAIFWSAMLGILIFHAPMLGKMLGVAWIITALLAPRIYLVTLVAALPLFGNNPGGPHHLYLLEIGMMAYVIRRFAERAIRPSPTPPADVIQSLLAFAFFGFSTGAMVPQFKRILCEIQMEGTGFLYANYSHYGNSPVFGIHAWTCLALSLAFYACVRRESVGARGRAFLIWTMIGSAFVAAMIGLLEYSGLLSLAWWRADNPMITRFGYRRLQSLFWHSGWFGQYLAAVSPAALAMALVGRGRVRIAAGGIYLILGCAELFTLQRGAWLGFIAGSVAVGLGFMLSSVTRDTRGRFIRRAFYVCALAGVILVMASLAHAPLRNRMMEMAKVSDRSGLWGGAYEIGMLRPWTGMGFGDFTRTHQLQFTEGSPYFNVDDKTTAHNLLLHIFAERGVLTMTSFALLVLVALGGLYRSMGTANAPSGDEGVPVPVERLAVFGGLIAIAVDGVFQYSFYLRVTEIVFWLFIAWAGRCFINFPSHTKFLGSVWTRMVLVLLCAGSMVFMSRDFIPMDGNISHEVDGWYVTEGEEVELEIPKDGTKFAIRVFSYDPLIAQGEPLTYAFWFRGALVGTHIFRKYDPAEIELFIPADRAPDEKLRIVASRVWNPYVATNRMVGKLEAGVCYRNFRALNATPVEGE